MVGVVLSRSDTKSPHWSVKIWSLKRGCYNED